MPVFFSKTYTTSANIAASGTSAENFISEADQHASAPFDQITVTNKGTVALRIHLDGSSVNYFDVPAYSLFSSRELKFRYFTIENLDTGIAHTAGDVTVLVENTKFKRRD